MKHNYNEDFLMEPEELVTTTTPTENEVVEEEFGCKFCYDKRKKKDNNQQSFIGSSYNTRRSDIIRILDFKFL